MVTEKKLLIEPDDEEVQEKEEQEPNGDKHYGSVNDSSEEEDEEVLIAEAMPMEESHRSDLQKLSEVKQTTFVNAPEIDSPYTYKEGVYGERKEEISLIANKGLLPRLEPDVKKPKSENIPHNHSPMPSAS